MDVDGSRAREMLVYSGSSRATIKSMAKPSKPLLKKHTYLTQCIAMHWKGLYTLKKKVTE